MKHLLTLLIGLCIAHTSFSQKRSRADRFFDNGDFLNAITEYKKDIDHSKLTKNNVQKIAIAYYNTFQFRNAYRYLTYVTKGKFTGKNKTYDNHLNFKLYQVLSALGEYDKAIPYLELYQKNNTISHKKRAEVIATIEEFKLKDDDYTIKPATFNSDQAEFGAVQRDSVLYFTSDRSPNTLLEKRYKWTHRPFLDIYKIKLDSLKQPTGEASSFSQKVNSNLHEGNFCFSKDGKTLYLSKSNNERGKKFDSIRNNAIHLYKSVKSDSLSTWSKPKKLPFNNINYTIEHPALNPEGTVLYFASNMPGGLGDFDLYSVTINTDGTYGIPKNLGSKINTINREQFPFINPNGDLFFSSNGHLGLGMLDIFASKKKLDSFNTPVNLGAPINSSFDDFSLTYHESNKGFFASNRQKGGDDVYAFTQIGKIFPNPIKTKFEIRDLASKDLIPNVTVNLVNKDKKELVNKKLDSISAFSTNLLPGRYDLTASANHYITQTKAFLTKEQEAQTYILYLAKKEIPIAVKKTPTTTPLLTLSNTKEQLLADKVGPPVKERNGKLFFEVPPIYFDFNKWNIRKDSKKVLDELALKLEKYSKVYIKISAHTDSRGTESYNQLLSERRAESTRNYLALVGYINARRLAFEGFGESIPLINCKDKICTEEEHQTNRRSEFEIIKY